MVASFIFASAGKAGYEASIVVQGLCSSSLPLLKRYCKIVQWRPRVQGDNLSLDHVPGSKDTSSEDLSKWLLNRQEVN